MVDVGNKADRGAAADFLAWLTGPGPSGRRAEMASRLGVMYVIYNRKSWSSYTGYWKDYTGYDPHTSHVHISLSWNGARAHTSFWTGRVWATDLGPCQYFDNQPAVVPPKRARIRECPAPVSAPRTSSEPFSWLGSSGSSIATAQRRLGVDDSGRFDIGTRRAVLRYQRVHDLPRTGALDKQTWASLKPRTSSTTAPSWTPDSAAAWSRNQAGSPVLRRQSTGLTVLALQTALRLPRSGRNGYFGGQTAAAVKQVKQSAGLGSGARVTAELWDLLPVS
jgi:peptidoglycan hydrolase-like protein with peptidoglycan-binding domain